MPRVTPCSRPPLAGLLALLALALGAAGCGAGRDLESPDPALRAAAVRSLGAGDPSQALAALLVAQADASPAVRLAAAETFARTGGPRAAEGLGALLLDLDPGVARAAAAGLASLPSGAGGKDRLLAAYAGATTAGRAAIAAALDRLGVALREAVEVEARTLWERNLLAVERGTGAARAGAAEELGASGRAEAVTRLLALLDGPGRTDRRLAAASARGLGMAGHRVARPRLELLLETSDRDVAVAAAEALQRLGDPGSADALALAAEGAGPPAVAALRALESLPKAPEVASALCAVALRAVEPGRAAAAARLAALRDRSCPVRPLLARLGRPGELAALAALAELRPEPTEVEWAAGRLLSWLASGQGSAETRSAAARALGGLGWSGAGAPLLERAVALGRKLADGRAKVAAPAAPASANPAGVAGRVPTPFTEPAGALELGATLAAAARLGAADVDPLLEPALGDSSAAVRAGAVEGLSLRGRAAAAPRVARAIADPVEAVRVAAVRALGRLGAAGTPALVAAAVAARAEDTAWRLELVRALGESAAPESVDGLAALLDGDSTGAAAQALARTGASSAAAPLARLLARSGAPALPDVIEALSQVGGADAAHAILAHLTSDRADVRDAAVRGLGRLRFEPASPLLEGLRSDYFGRIRRAAVEALARLPARRPSGRP
jgi:HEAT repeat protein